MMLYLYNYKGELLQQSGIACGKNFGDKKGIGDYKHRKEYSGLDR